MAPQAATQQSITQQSMTQQEWHAVKQALAKDVSQANYTTWIEPLKLADIQNGVALLHASTHFAGSYVEQNFGDLILHRLMAAGRKVVRLRFATPKPAAATRPGKSASAAPLSAASATEPKGRTQAPTMAQLGAPLDPRMTFRNFVVGTPNELGHAAAQRAAQGNGTALNPLYLYGGVGLGKTHLLQAIAWETQSLFPDRNTLYLPAEQFMFRFVQALRARKIMDFKQVLRSVDVLIIDDMQFIAGKNATQEEFFHTFNALIAQQKQIIISADRAPGEIPHLGERLGSRLQCGLVADLQPPDYDLRLEILRAKVKECQTHHPSVAHADGVLELLAQRITGNVRVLEGALNRLYVFAALGKRAITPALVHECLSDLLRGCARKISAEDIQRHVAKHYDIRLADMIGPKRTRNLVRPRQIAMYLCKTLTSLSLPEIGRHFGGRDHTTVTHSVQRVEKIGLTDSQLADDLQTLKYALRP
ncbi:MAG: chromosomal replication initiator protein DnaA [Rhodobacteraceae bacterium]|nr:chromosomal replication initiator protein DnaA [Paracoccaceae bacterium]